MVEKKYKNKEALVAELHEKLGSASAVVVTEYRGLKAGDLVKLRRSLKESQVEVYVVKNTLLRRAAAGTPSEAIVGDLAGPTAIAIASGEAIDAAKGLAKNAGDFDPFNLKGGIIEKSVFDANGVAAVAKLPGKTEMHGQFAGALEGFVGEFVFCVEAVVREFAGLLEAQAEKAGAAA